MPRSYHGAILVLWLAWRFYWLLASLRNKPTRRRESVAVIVSAFVHKLGIEERFLTQQFGDGYALPAGSAGAGPGISLVAAS